MGDGTVFEALTHAIATIRFHPVIHHERPWLIADRIVT
jgi:hypothetical protein